MGLVLFLVVFSAIFVAFTNEIATWLKKVLSVTWVRVCVPMVLISCLWVWFDEEVLWVLEYLQQNLHFFTAKFAVLLPHQLMWSVARVLILYLSASIPAWLFYWKLSRDDSSFGKYMPRLAKLYAFSWVFFSVLILA